MKSIPENATALIIVWAVFGGLFASMVLLGVYHGWDWVLPGRRGGFTVLTGLKVFGISLTIPISVTIAAITRPKRSRSGLGKKKSDQHGEA